MSEIGKMHASGLMHGINVFIQAFTKKVQLSHSEDSRVGGDRADGADLKLK